MVPIPPGVDLRRVSFAALAAACAALAPMLELDLGTESAFLPACATAVFLLALMSGVLLLQRFIGHGSSRLLGLATTYLATAGVIGMSCIPGMHVGGTIVWVAVAGGFPVGLAAAVWGGPADLRRTLADPALRRDHAALWAPVAALALAAVLLAILDAVPRFTLREAAPVVLAISVLALASVARRGRRGALEPWLPFVVTCNGAGAGALALADRAGDLAWYAGFLLGVVGSSVLLLVLTAEVGRLHRRLDLDGAARRDPLTGLPTRAAVLGLAEELRRMRAPGVPLAVGVVDIDRLTRVNDAYGDLAGDTAVRIAAGRVRSALRDDDLCGRSGEADFILVLPRTDLAGAVLAADRILEALRATPAWGGPREVALTASAGVALVEDGDAGLERALDTAAQALLRAKDRGRDQVVAVGETLEALPPMLPPATPSARPTR